MKSRLRLFQTSYSIALNLKLPRFLFNTPCLLQLHRWQVGRRPTTRRKQTSRNLQPAAALKTRATTFKAGQHLTKMRAQSLHNSTRRVWTPLSTGVPLLLWIQEMFVACCQDDEGTQTSGNAKSRDLSCLPARSDKTYPGTVTH